MLLSFLVESAVEAQPTKASIATRQDKTERMRRIIRVVWHSIERPISVIGNFSGRTLRPEICSAENIFRPLRHGVCASLRFN